MKTKILLWFFVAFAVSVSAKNEFTLNFNNVDIRSLIKFVSEYTQENYVLDPGVKGTITVFSQKPVPAEDVDRIFRSILSLYGFTVVKKGDVSFIVPLEAGKVQSNEVTTGAIPASRRGAYINQVVTLKYYPATTIQTILNPYVGKGGQVIVEPRGNMLIISDIGDNVAKLMDLIEKLDVPSPPGKDEFRIYRLENAVSEEVAKVLNEILSKKRSAAAVRTATPAGQPIQPAVVSSKSVNSLIVYAEPEDFETIEKIIKSLDVMPSQVLIEALIAEVNYDKTSEIGFKWFSMNTFKQGEYTGTAGMDFGINSTTGAITEGLSIGITKGLGGVFNMEDFMKAYGSESSFNILGTPQIMTSDNQEASINVVENISYVSQVSFTGGYGSTAGDTIKNFSYKDVGIILKITPQISRNKYVRLKIYHELSTLIPGTDAEAPWTSTRKADTVLIVPDEKTIVLGGLIRDHEEIVTEKIPGLGDIWLIGKLFQRTRKTTTKKNLLIFITPHIVNSFEDSERIRAEKKKVMDEFKATREFKEFQEYKTPKGKK